MLQNPWEFSGKKKKKDLNPKQVAKQDISVCLKGWTSLKSSQTEGKVQGNYEKTVINDYKLCAPSPRLLWRAIKRSIPHFKFFT